MKPLFFGCLLMAGNAMAGATDCIPVWHYHNWPPFLFEGEQRSHSISVAFVDMLDQLDEQHCYQLTPLPRATLNQHLSARKEGLLLWGNPLWFKRLFPPGEPWLQASRPLYWDSDVVVSLRSRPVHYTEPASLAGKRIGGVEGFYFPDVTELSAAGKLQLISGANDDVNVKRLFNGEIDAMVITHTSIQYLRHHQKDTDIFYIAPQPQDAYSRHVLATPRYHAILPLINGKLRALQHQPRWQALLKSHHLDDLIDFFALSVDELGTLDVHEPVKDASP